MLKHIKQKSDKENIEKYLVHDHIRDVRPFTIEH